MRTALCRADEVAVGQLRRCEAGRVAVVVVRGHDGRLHAMRDACAHQGAPLSAGVVQPMVVADRPGHYSLAKDREVLRCPWHAYEYELENGRSPSDPERTRVRTYPVRIENGEVIVDL